MAPLLARTPSADRQFERMYQRYVSDVYRYAHAVLRNAQDAEDVTQTTFLNAYRAMQKGERPDAPKNWLITIAHNVCRQRFRQAQRRPQESPLFEDGADAAVPEKDERYSAEDIQRAMGQLAFNQRAALVARELEGRSYAEIAEIMGVTVSSVETLLFRARRALREQLEGNLTCTEAEFFLSKQADGALSRAERGQLRAHLRECKECEQLARKQRASRGALKALLGGIPLPTSLWGGSGVTAGLATKAAAVVCAGAVVSGGGYEAAKHIHVAPAKTVAASTAQAPVARIPSAAIRQSSLVPSAAPQVKPIASRHVAKRGAKVHAPKAKAPKRPHRVHPVTPAVIQVAKVKPSKPGPVQKAKHAKKAKAFAARPKQARHPKTARAASPGHLLKPKAVKPAKPVKAVKPVKPVKPEQPAEKPAAKPEKPAETVPALVTTVVQTVTDALDPGPGRGRK